MKSVRESLTVPEGFSPDTSVIMELQEFLKKFKTFKEKNGIKFLLLLEEKTRRCFICLMEECGVLQYNKWIAKYIGVNKLQWTGR